MWKELRSALTLLIVFTLLTGGIYPLFVTGIGQAAFPEQANGSLIKQGDKAIGSALIGQNFSDPKYFWGRPSATSPQPYNAGASSGANQGPTNPALTDAIAGRIKALQEADPNNKTPIPVDLVTASASGLDPHITPAAAAYQANRVAQTRGIAIERVRSLVDEYKEERQFGFLGEPRVNVLKLNHALDMMEKRT